jgi:hypothetical protein
MSAAPNHIQCRTRPVHARALPWMSVLFFLVLSACVLDRELRVRAQLNQWVILGDTLFFNSTRDCTAAVFDTTTTSVLSGAKKVRSIERGLRLIGQDQVVAFDMAAMTPADMYEQIDKAYRRVSLRMLVSGLAARDCLSGPFRDAFVQALNTTNVVLVFDPENAAMALFDRVRKQVIYTRAQS